MKFIRSMKIDLIAAACGSVLIFLLAFSNNVLSTALHRSLQSFALFFLLSLIVRMLLMHILRQENDKPGQVPEQSGQHAGSVIDFTTPEDDGEELFEPLQPDELAVKNLDPKEIASAVRTMSKQ